ncbi:MAG TPA: hypothetical protein VJ881_10615 [Halanaerobiales bacterium]|nr:hypothetical protein [Halanaerobiales bacterium]
MLDPNIVSRVRKIARVWSLVLIIIVLFIIGGYFWNWITTGVTDPYAVEDYPPIENIPPLLEVVAVIGLAIAWRRERLGAIINILLSLLVFPILLIYWPISSNFLNYLLAPYGTWLLILIPGILFFLCSQKVE